MPPFAVALSLKFPKSHPDRCLSAPWLKSLVLALAARNNIMEKGREKESLSAAKHINLQIYLVVIIPEGETYSILHHLRNCPHLFGDSNRQSGACASSSSEATCCCCPSSRSPHPTSEPSQLACTLRDVSRYFPSSWKCLLLRCKLSSAAEVLAGKYLGTARNGEELSKKPLDC